MKLQIKSWLTGGVLFEAETDNWRVALELAVKSGANLSRAYLSGADLSGADLSGADLSGAYLSRAYLSGADLSRADLSGANLSRAYLSGANLSGADLSGADLSGADLSGANLSGANLSGATGLKPEAVQPLLMLLDQPGPIRAYKLVTADGKSPMAAGNGAPVLDYKKGSKHKVANANEDVTELCGAGLHVATLDWCLREWSAGWRVLIVEFTAKDIACIPTASDGKFRVRRLKVVGEKDVTHLVGGKAVSA